MKARLTYLATCAAFGSMTVVAANMAFGQASPLSADTVARTAIAAFAQNCFSPFLTAQKAKDVILSDGVRLDFYDLDPFSSAAVSPAVGRAVTPGTDRRCEVSFDGEYTAEAADAAGHALESEGITDVAALPDQFQRSAGTQLLAARRLNPRRIAVVHVGLRNGVAGPETFMLVERMMPEQG